MKKWEYICQRLIYDSPNLEQGLDELGASGWEMVGTGKIRTGISTISETLILFFKRKITEPPTKPGDDGLGTKIVPRGETEEYL